MASLANHAKARTWGNQPRIWVLTSFFLFAWALPNWAQEFKAGQLYPQVMCQLDESFSYSLYLPKNYGSQQAHPLVLIFDPASRSGAPLEVMRQAADQFGYVLACSSNTGNLVSFGENLKAAKAFWQDVATRFKVDRERTYTAGFSGGARLASEIAIITGNIAGTIVCGAGFRDTSHARKTLPFPIALVIGVEDMNFMELTDIDRKLGFVRTTHRLFTFEGGHQWPPAEEFHKVFAWLDLQAMRMEKIPSDSSFIEKAWKDDLDQANRWLKEGDMVGVQRHYESLVADYEGLRDTSFAANHAKRIRKTVAYKNSLQRKTRLENAEKLKQRNYVKKLREQGAQLPEDLEELPAQVRPWLTEKQRQDRHIASTKKDDERLMSIRVNDFAWRMCSERAMRLFIAGSYREALFLYLVVTNYVPEYGFHFIQVAKCYAQLGAGRTALAYLERGLKKGVYNPKAISEDPSFDKIRPLPKFQELFAGE